MLMIANIIGTIGVLFCLIAYFLLQCGKITPAGLSFSIYNLLGSTMITFSLLYDWNLPAFLIESAWALISVFGIVRILLKRRNE